MAIKGPQYRFKDGVTPLNADELNKRMLDVDARLDPLERKTVEYDAAILEVQNAGLERINEVLVPAYERVRRLEGLGFLIAPIESDTPFAFEEGQQALVVANGGNGEGYRDLFTPSPFLAFTREAEADSYAIARLVSYSQETGALVVDVVSVGNGSAVSATDVWVAGAAGSTVAQIEMLLQTITARNTATTERQAAQTARVGAEDALDDVTILRGQVATDRAEVQARRDEVRQIIAPSGATPPDNPVLGQFWWDGTQTRVYDGVGFVPAVTASIGGLRMDEGTFGAATTGEVVVGGGFQSIMVWVNGALLSKESGDYTEDGSKFVVAGAAEGEEWAYWAYQAISSADYYTKEEVDGIASTKAPLASPDLTGIPTAPTAPAGDNSTRLANTAFVQAALTALKGGVAAAYDTLAELAAGLATKLTASLNLSDLSDKVAARANLGVAWEKIRTDNPAGASSVIWTQLGVYKQLRLTGYVSPSLAAPVGLRASLDDGATWRTNSDDYRRVGTGQAGASAPTSISATDSYFYLNSIENEAPSEICDFELLISNTNGGRLTIEATVSHRGSASGNRIKTVSTMDTAFVGPAGGLHLSTPGSTFNGRVTLEGMR